jgi:flagellar hook assembly protein FlgD
MTLTGELVVKINHNNDMVKGRQLHWDGRNKDGNYISSGVYIVMAYNDEGKSKAGKIAVVRE